MSESLPFGHPEGVQMSAPRGESLLPQSEQAALLRRRWGRLYRMAVPDLITPIALKQKLHGDDPELPESQRNLRRLVDKGIPYAETAWRIGQILREYVMWSSGPVSLWLAGYFDDAIGFFAVWLRQSPDISRAPAVWLRQSPDISRASAARAFNDMRLLRYIASENVLDQLPYIEETYADIREASTEEQFEQFRYAMRVKIAERDEEAYILRAKAEKSWTLPSQTLENFDDLWKVWLAEKPLYRDRLRPEDDVRLRQAYRIATSPEFTPGEKESFALFWLTVAFEALMPS